MHPLHVQQERSHQTPKGNDFKQKHIYRLSAVQNTSQERWDFGWHYLASCPTPPGRGTLPGAAVRVLRPPHCPEALRPGRGGLAPRSSPSVSEKRFSASPSLSREEEALSGSLPSAYNQALTLGRSLWPGPPANLSLSTSAAAAAILPAPPARAPLAARRRRRRSAQAQCRASPDRQHGGRAKAGAGHRGAPADGAFGGRLYQPGSELRHGPWPGVCEEQLQGGGVGG